MMRSRLTKSPWFGPTLVALVLLVPCDGRAGERRHRARAVVAVPTAKVRNYDPDRSLGTFGPTPYLFVRGNGVAGGGYSPGDSFGDVAMDIYGPLSAFRSISAPVVVYTRGYNGVMTPSIGTSFSNPNRPALSPVVYPTQANNYYGFPVSGTPPWWAKGGSFIDEN